MYGGAAGLLQRDIEQVGLNIIKMMIGLMEMRIIILVKMMIILLMMMMPEIIKADGRLKLVFSQ